VQNRNPLLSYSIEKVAYTFSSHKSLKAHSKRIIL
jgi:hypothetical protein